MLQATAVVAVSPRVVKVQSIEAPEPGPEEAVIRITHSWISNGTEGSFVRGERIGGDTPRREGDPLPFPIVTGYQKVGIVEQVGAAIGDLRVGEMVFATVSRTPGMYTATGGHISPAVTHRSQIWKLPPGVDPLAVSGLVLTQVGYNCGMRPEIRPGDAAVVIGDGMVGHWAAQTLAHRGARVMMVGRHDERLARYTPGPGDHRVNVRQEDPVGAARDWAPEGLQAVVDTVGSVRDIERFLDQMHRLGHIVSAGFHGTRGLIDIQPLRNREITLHAPAGWTKERMDATLSLVAQGALVTTHLITHHFPVQRAAEAFDLILSRREPVLGVILDWA
jgi:3-hydroxyethyl bacteriochlorophyllide a dehydrogenase